MDIFVSPKVPLLSHLLFHFLVPLSHRPASVDTDKLMPLTTLYRCSYMNMLLSGEGLRLLSVRMYFRLVHVFITSFFCCTDEWSPLSLYRVGILNLQCWASEVHRFHNFWFELFTSWDVTQVDTWNSFMFPYISYMCSLKVTGCKLYMNSFNVSADWLWCILFVFVLWCWPSKGFRFWRTSYVRLLDYFYLYYLLFTCLIFSSV